MQQQRRQQAAGTHAAGRRRRADAGSSGGASRQHEEGMPCIRTKESREGDTCRRSKIIKTSMAAADSKATPDGVKEEIGLSESLHRTQHASPLSGRFR